MRKIVKLTKAAVVAALLAHSPPGLDRFFVERAMRLHERAHVHHQTVSRLRKQKKRR